MIPLAEAGPHTNAVPVELVIYADLAITVRSIKR